VDYDYSLLDINETEPDNQDIPTKIDDNIEEFSTPTEDTIPPIWQEKSEDPTPINEEKKEVWNDKKNDDDTKNRAKIFRTF